MDVEKDVSENVAPPQEYGILSPKTAFVVNEPTDIVQQITLFVHSHQCIYCMCCLFIFYNYFSTSGEELYIGTVINMKA